MNTWCVIATGESLKPDPAAHVAFVRHLPCVAINDAYKVAPWARALVSSDPNWWTAHREARKSFAGEKWSQNSVSGVRQMAPAPWIWTNTNSGLLGLHFAVQHCRADRVLLLGIDMHGTHYFGEHDTSKGLANTDEEKFKRFIRQFNDYAKHMRKGVDVVNTSMSSALTCFRKLPLREAIQTERAVA